MANISFSIACKELKIAQISQPNQLFQCLDLVHIERFSLDCRIGIGFGFGFGLTTSFGWLVYLLWFWFYDSQVKTALYRHGLYELSRMLIRKM